MKLAKEKNIRAEKGKAGQPAKGRLTIYSRAILVLLVFFVSVHSFSAARIRLDGHPSSIPSLEKRQPFVPPVSHGLKTSFVSVDERSDYSWFVADQARDAVLLVARVVVGMTLNLFDSDDPPGSFLVLPLRI